MNQIAIAAGHELTAQTAADILKAGGNAIDAAIAAYLVSWIAEPCMASAGGGAFATVFHEQEAYVFDFFTQTPSQKRPASEVDFYPIDVDFGGTLEQFHIGKGSSAVPGSVAGVFAMHERLATMPFKDLVYPAIKAAKEGVEINDFQAFDLQLLEPIFRVSERAKPFFKGNDLLVKGDTLKLPYLADFLDYMSSEGSNAFYQGEVAQKLVAEYQTGGGFLTLDDLKNYKAIVRKPLQFKHRKKTILTNPLPSTGGSIIALLMAYLGETPSTQKSLSLAHIKQWYKAFKTLEAHGKEPEQLAAALQKVYNISPKGNDPATNRRGSTSHFNIVDKWNNAVSLTTTIGEGCGYFIEGTDIHMNNMLGEAALLPNGFHSWLPNTRLSSMMSPTIVLNESDIPEIVTGSGGASRIPSAIAQVLHYLIDYQLSLQEAIDHPRLHLQHDVYNIEHGFNVHPNSNEFQDKLMNWTEASLYFGGVHTIKRVKNTFEAVGDDRRDGVAFVI